MPLYANGTIMNYIKPALIEYLHKEILPGAEGLTLVHSNRTREWSIGFITGSDWIEIELSGLAKELDQLHEILNVEGEGELWDLAGAFAKRLPFADLEPDSSEIEKLISDTELSQKEAEELQRMIVIRSNGKYKLENWQLRSLVR